MNSQNIPTTSKKINSLICEVHENFDSEISDSHHYKSTIRAISPFEGDYNNKEKTSDFLKSYSPSTAASYFNQNFDENGYVFDGIKIEIDDIDNTSISNATTSELKRCKQQVLRHYYSLLCFIGWRPAFKEEYYRVPCFLRLFNVFYPIIIILLLFFCIYI